MQVFLNFQKLCVDVPFIKTVKNQIFNKMGKIGFFKIAAILLMLAGSFFSCAKRGESSSQDTHQGIYYVVGYDGSAEVDIQKGTAQSGGYLFISENLKDSLLVNNRFEVKEGEFNSYRLGDLLNGIIDIPVEAFLEGGCRFTYFPEEYRFVFKVQINSYRPMTEEEKLDVPRLVNAMCMPTFHISYDNEFFPFRLIVITSISKI